jgi:hypothetical protein
MLHDCTTQLVYGAAGRSSTRRPAANVARSRRGRGGASKCNDRLLLIWRKLEATDVLSDLNEVGEMRNVEGVNLRMLLTQLLEHDPTAFLAPLHVGTSDEEREALNPVIYWRLPRLALGAMRVLERDVSSGRRGDVRGRHGPRRCRRLRVSPEGPVFVATEVPDSVRRPIDPDLDDRPELRLFQRSGPGLPQRDVAVEYDVVSGVPFADFD